MAVGIIGTGNMGSILTEALILGGGIDPSEVVITNRTIEKAYLLKKSYPDVIVAKNSIELTKQAEIVFICIKPLGIKALLDQIKPALTPDHTVISITSPITVRQIESVISSKVARMIPSITNRALSGSTLLTFGTRFTENDKKKLRDIVCTFSEPIEIEEPVTRAASDISSCGPAFISYLLEQMIEASIAETKITHELATKLTTTMIIGLGKLLEKNVYSLETLRKKVHVKGGVTGEGLKILEDELGFMFHHMFQKTHDKFNEDHYYVDQQFNQNDTSN